MRQAASKPLHELWGEGKQLADDGDMDKIVTAYQRAWEPYEKTVLNGMCDVMELEFYQNNIDVYIAPWFHAFSDPMVIGVKYSPDVFVDILTHELLHRLLSHNTIVWDSPGLQKLEAWQELFGHEHSHKMLVHIPVHAVHKALYLDVLKEPKRLERDKQNVEERHATDYIDAWHYVDEHGYEKIIDQLKQSYRSAQ